ncbi:MAG: hypothetical protein KJO13_01145 [Gammaproteobacteria bacterium]|nr:hypothetical protein [Gammaproteobacteria bacterium]
MLRVTYIAIMFATLFVFGLSFADAIDAGGTPNSFAHTFVLFLHQLLLVYWIGPDIAVFVWSRLAVNPQLGPEQRVTAGRMMTVIDLVPRVCLALFLTVAGILSETYGITHPWWQMVGIVLLGPVWLFIVLGAWLKQGSEFGRTLATFDIWVRVALVIGIPASVAYSTMTGRLEDTPWITGKLMILAAVILLGLLMRLRLQGFFDGVDRLAADGPSPETDRQMATSQKRSRPFVYAIWLLLLWAALLGVVKPGDTSLPAAASNFADAPAQLARGK